MFKWPALDKEGEVLDVLVKKRQTKAAALKLLGKPLKNQGLVPEQIVTEDLLSYTAELRDLGCMSRHRPGDYAKTAAWSIRTCRFDVENGKCNGSNPKARPSGSPQLTAQSTIPSMSNIT